MPKIRYQKINLGKPKLEMIAKANEIIAEYAVHGLDLTLRQLYYQCVARNILPNKDKWYKWLGTVIADARLAGLIDWNVIVDRTRYLRDLSHWDSPQALLDASAAQFRYHKWDAQPEYVEVWIEKDALLGVIEGVCQENDVPYMACRGYASVSEIWRAGHNRLRTRIEQGKECTVFYLGDHDPSGIDMSRDLQERIDMFTGMPGYVHIERLALNMDQVEVHEPPPNPTKQKDSRTPEYEANFGKECWELDALDPLVIRNLIQTYINMHRDEQLWQESVRAENVVKAQFKGVSANWQKVVAKLP